MARQWFDQKYPQCLSLQSRWTRAPNTWHLSQGAATIIQPICTVINTHYSVVMRQKLRAAHAEFDATIVIKTCNHRQCRKPKRCNHRNEQKFHLTIAQRVRIKCHRESTGIIFKRKSRKQMHWRWIMWVIWVVQSKNLPKRFPRPRPWWRWLQLQPSCGSPQC